ncbi:uncharacterized protein J3D65DRAFT_605961 [Phyllosticta citribraziliensis]|uniref:Uncharacterized protein n=1 Tax=Phyllosticta citribraziliensis TaxID=989973 RepID=A0ABR1L9R9_9PEZI
MFGCAGAQSHQTQNSSHSTITPSLLILPLSINQTAKLYSLSHENTTITTITQLHLLLPSGNDDHDEDEGTLGGSGLSSSNNGGNGAGPFNFAPQDMGPGAHSVLDSIAASRSRAASTLLWSPALANTVLRLASLAAPNNTSMYPTLPSFSAMSDTAGSYPVTSNAPNLTLDSENRQQRSDNQPHEAGPARDSGAMDISDNDSTPNASRRNSVDRDGLRMDVRKLAPRRRLAYPGYQISVHCLGQSLIMKRITRLSSKSKRTSPELPPGKKRKILVFAFARSLLLSGAAFLNTFNPQEHGPCITMFQDAQAALEDLAMRVKVLKQDKEILIRKIKSLVEDVSCLSGNAAFSAKQTFQHHIHQIVMAGGVLGSSSSSVTTWRAYTFGSTTTSNPFVPPSSTAEQNEPDGVGTM